MNKVSELEGELYIGLKGKPVYTLYQVSRTEEFWEIDLLSDDGTNSEFMRLRTVSDGSFKVAYERNGVCGELEMLPFVIGGHIHSMSRIPNLKRFIGPLASIASIHLEPSDGYIN